MVRPYRYIFSIGAIFLFCLGISVGAQFLVFASFIFAGIGFWIDNAIKKQEERSQIERINQERLDREAYAKQKRIQIMNQQIAEAKDLAKTYPEATKYYFKTLWGISKYKILDTDITYERACYLLAKKGTYELDEKRLNPFYRSPDEERAIREKQERESAKIKEYLKELEEFAVKERIKKNLPVKVSSWEKFKTIPYYFFYYYYPTKFTIVTSESQKARKLIWNFKEGLSVNQTCMLVGDKLRKTFSSEELRELTFVGIPASNRESHKNRYETFCKMLCNYTGMKNAYPHIRITKEKSPKHLSLIHDSEMSEYDFDKSFFKDARIILFDDVVTQGTTLLTMKMILENELKALIIGAISLGRTYSDFNGINYQPHPYSNIL